MNEKNKKSYYEISTLALKAVLCVMLVISALVYLCFGLINKNHILEDEPVKILNDWDMVYEDNGDQKISAILPRTVGDNEYLFFDTRIDVSVSINGEFRTDFVGERDVKTPGGAFKDFMMQVPLKAQDADEKIEIIRSAPGAEDEALPQFYIGTLAGFRSFQLKSGGPSFVLSLIVLTFAFVAFLVSIALTFLYKQRIDMLYGVLGIFIIASWVITDSDLFPIVFGVNHINNILSYLLCLTMPLPLMIYLDSVQRGRYRKTTIVVAIVAILNATVWPILQFTKIITFDQMRTPANMMLVLLACLGLFMLIMDAIKGNISGYRYTFIGFIGFLVGGILELLTVILEVTYIRKTSFMVIGLGFLLTFIVIQQVHDLHKVNLDKQHAIDISEAKTKFLASMSHEIRTPINAILGMNEMILRENEDETIDEYARSIKTSGKMLLMLVNDVLDFTKIEAGKLEIKESEFLMPEMLYDVLSLIKERAEEKSLTLECKITDEVPNELISDEFRIRQILVNLMNNAVKYTEKGTVTLKIGGEFTESGYLLRFFVEDTGKGIPKEDQEHLFEAFSRADMKSNINVEGTGLGLAIVKSIVDSMEGDVGVDSEYGVGSTFWVKLPVKYQSRDLLKDDFMEHRSKQAESMAASSFSAPSANILAVDDNQSNLTIVKLFLKRDDIVPDLCNSGRRAIELCKEKKYDLILLDHMMPEPDGIETLHAIRKDADSLNKDTKAIVLTANAVAGSRQMYIREGFEDYLTKPLDSGVLEETIKKLLPTDKVIKKEEDNKAPAKSEEGSFAPIEGMDYETALKYCAGDEEFLHEIMGDIAKEGFQRLERMKKNLDAKDIAAYEIDAHAIKSSMATIGLKDFSERAKKHEFAAKDRDMDTILADADSFLKDYNDLLEKLDKLAT
ncbi:MAG: response regulator [Lachnospiraceae bacterium]|nr:response regulator [Lachnospiraceae bacterium]